MKGAKGCFFCFLAPGSLAFFSREEAHGTREGVVRLAMNQLVWLIMRAATFVFWRRTIALKAEGVEHIPRSGPVLVAARHFHYLYDGFVLVNAIPRRLHTIVALDWVKVSALRLVIEFSCALAGWPVVLRGEQLHKRAADKNGAYKPVESRRYLRQVMRATARFLRAGELMVIFPEGYPNVDPHPTPKTDLTAFLPFRPGFVKMVELAEKDHRTRVAIVPAGLAYTQVRKDHWQVTVRFGQPFFLTDFASSDLALHSVEASVQALSCATSLPSSGGSGQVEG